MLPAGTAPFLGYTVREAWLLWLDPQWPQDRGQMTGCLHQMSLDKLSAAAFMFIPLKTKTKVAGLLIQGQLQ